MASESRTTNKGLKFQRKYTKEDINVFDQFEYDYRTSVIRNPSGEVVFEMNNVEVPKQWSQIATDILAQKYFRKAGVPQQDGSLGRETSVKQVAQRMANCWRVWGERYGYFATFDDAQIFYEELVYSILNQMCVPNSPQWFNTGLHESYGIKGKPQGHYFVDQVDGQLKKSTSAYERPQPHACFILSVEDDLVNDGGIMDLWVREARIFKYGSGVGTNFSNLRGEGEKLSGGGTSSGLMSFLKIGDRAAGAIKSGGTTRRAAKMVCLDLDHPDIEDFINWKVREELQVAAMAEGLKRLPKEQQETARRLGLKLDYDFNGEAYLTVSGQNSNNSIRIPDSFFKALEDDGDWTLTYRSDRTKVAKTIKARDLWEQIAYAAWRCADPGVQYDDTINAWHTCPKSGKINASNPCVTGDTRVLTPGGIWRRIDQMIHLPSRVVTNLDGQEIHVTDGAFPTSQKDVYELRTAGGYSLKLTADHKVWTRHRGWVEAKDLETSDEVRLPSQPACVSQIGEPQDPTFFQLLGCYLSDGNSDTTGLRLEGSLSEPAQVEQFSRYVADNWGARLYNDDYVDRSMIDGAESSPEDASDTPDESGRATSAGTAEKTVTATLTNRRLISRLKAFVRTEPGTGLRRLSDEAFTVGLAAQKHLLRAMFTADARLTHNSLELASDSRGLLEDVQLILLGFGVQSAVYDLGLDSS